MGNTTQLGYIVFMSRKKTHTSELLTHVGSIIKMLRLRNGFSQEELAHRSSIHVTTLSEIEGGKANITLVTCESVASALNVPMASLFPDEHIREDEELSRLIARIQKTFTDSDTKDKARYINLLKSVTDNFS